MLKGAPRQRICRSRGSFTAKIHLLASAAGLPVRSDITARQTYDTPGVGPVMAGNPPAPSVMLPDRGHDAGSIRETMDKRGVLPVIPRRTSRKKRVAVERPLHCLRNLVERCVNKLKNARRVATRHDKTRQDKTRQDKTAEGFLDFVYIALIRLWVRPFST
ncbi:transposase [Salipiger pacificus]|uniref:Transposase n=1 Tax=Salipiger mangrovisoli TaxID=2865933 RepID=A0ABR9X582_9RHOB|nr:transposase [Salipiger mangrovisoli]